MAVTVLRLVQADDTLSDTATAWVDIKRQLETLEVAVAALKKQEAELASTLLPLVEASPALAVDVDGWKVSIIQRRNTVVPYKELFNAAVGMLTVKKATKLQLQATEMTVSTTRSYLKLSSQ